MHSTTVHEGSDGDATRTTMAQHAERLASYAGMLAELIRMREDDRANAMRGACAKEMRATNEAFMLLALQLAANPSAKPMTVEELAA